MMVVAASDRAAPPASGFQRPSEDKLPLLPSSSQEPIRFQPQSSQPGTAQANSNVICERYDRLQHPFRRS